MPEVKVQQATEQKREHLPVFREMEKVMEQVRKRAFDLFSWRGFGDGRALDDWLAAEREICWPAAQLAEEGPDYVLSVSLPGFEASEVTVTATPGELIVHAKAEKRAEDARADAKTCWTEFRSDDVYRRIELDKAIDVNSVTASLKNGMLRVAARKTGEASRRVPVSAAA